MGGGEQTSSLLRAGPDLLPSPGDCGRGPPLGVLLLGPQEGQSSTCNTQTSSGGKPGFCPWDPITTQLASLCTEYVCQQTHCGFSYRETWAASVQVLKTPAVGSRCLPTWALRATASWLPWEVCWLHAEGDARRSQLGQRLGPRAGPCSVSCSAVCHPEILNTS